MALNTDIVLWKTQLVGVWALTWRCLLLTPLMPVLMALWVLYLFAYVLPLFWAFACFFNGLIGEGALSLIAWAGWLRLARKTSKYFEDDWAFAGL